MLSTANLSAATDVVVCFHGYAGDARCARDWHLSLPGAPAFIYLDAPLRYGDGFSWFDYERDEEAPGPTQAHTLSEYMRDMRLEASVASMHISIRVACRLFGLLARQRKRVFFVGTSQGAALAFTAAAHILAHSPRRAQFRGCFSHHMAGVYPCALPWTPRFEVRISHDPADESHGHWLPSERAMLVDTYERATLTVCLHQTDKVVPPNLARFLNECCPSACDPCHLDGGNAPRTRRNVSCVS